MLAGVIIVAALLAGVQERGSQRLRKKEEEEARRRAEEEELARQREEEASPEADDLESEYVLFLFASICCVCELLSLLPVSQHCTKFCVKYSTLCVLIH